MEAAPERLVGGDARAGHAHDGLELDGHGPLLDQLLEVASSFEELAGQGEGHEGRGLRAVVPLGLVGLAPDAELEVAEVEDVAFGDLGLGNRPVIHVGAVAALLIADLQDPVLLEDLGVQLGNTVRGQDQLEPGPPADAEGQRLDRHQAKAMGALGHALEHPLVTAHRSGELDRCSGRGRMGETKERSSSFELRVCRRCAEGAAGSHVHQGKQLPGPKRPRSTARGGDGT